MQKTWTGSNNWETFLKSKGVNVEPKSDETHPEEEDGGIVPKCRCVAIDCEMVGIGEDTKTNMLARVSIVNSVGDCLYDTFVKPTAPVTDYRTPVSGVRQSDLINAEKFVVVQRKVANIIKGKILVGHAVHNDLIVLKLYHPNHCIRDTARFKRFNDIAVGTPSLKKLTSHFLQVNIQDGEHNSIQDAQAAMQLYMLYRKEWEAEIRKHRHHFRHRSGVSKHHHAHKGNKINRNYKVL